MVDKAKLGKCCMHFWRFTFMILNILFFLIGLALIALAIYLLATQNDLAFLTGTRFASGAVIILIAGLITSVISFVGILAAIGMWWCVYLVYIILMVTIVILEIAAGISGFIFRDELVDVAMDRGLDAIGQYSVDGDGTDVNSIIDFIQERFDCCGYTSFDDWFDTGYFNDTMRFPDSCNCSDQPTVGSGSGQNINVTEDQCMVAPIMIPQVIYVQSCNESVNEFLRNNLVIIGGVGIAFGLFEIIGIALGIGLCVCSCLKKKGSDDYDFAKAI